MKKILKNERGFSYAELLVVVGVLLVMLGMSFVSYRSVDHSRKLKMSAQKLASDSRKMQSYVLNLHEHGGSFPDGGWGIFFDKAGNNDRYYLFADNSNIGTRGFYYELSELYQEVVLPAGVFISRIDTFGATNYLDANSVSINYSPPDPATHICHNWGQCNSSNFSDRSEITLSNSDGSASKKIIINKYGLIDVEN